MDDTPQTFHVSAENAFDHVIGDPACSECWTSPIPCTCGGLIHDEFGDENYNGDYWTWRKCDQCGDDFQPA